MTQAPTEVVELARQRDAARRSKDFAAADQLREEISEAGWIVVDEPTGFSLRPRPPFDVVATTSLLASQPPCDPVTPVSVLLLIDGWPADVKTSVEAWLATSPANTRVALLDLGNVEGSGSVAHAFAEEHPGRVVVWHVDQTMQQAGFGPAMNALARLANSEVLVIADLSSVPRADVVTPLVDTLTSTQATAVGWRGVNANQDDAWRSFDAAGPGEVDAVLGYLFAVRRDAFEGVDGYSSKARYYRNADIELSLSLREANATILSLGDALDVEQTRHHGYHDTPDEYRDRESRRNYERILARFRGRTELLAPRVG